MQNIISKLNINTEKIVFIIFCILTSIISFYHEPWLDEFQAWAVSKDSLYNILFVVPHYEGHPPLWHLILKFFSYFNVPFEYGLKIPNLLFMFGAVWLLIFKSPFVKPVRLLLPFTYFIFYQYSIISRPYSIFCFALFLAAYFYKTKNEHPYRFAGVLALLCLSSFYGILFAGGITIAWLIEVLKSVNIKVFIKSKICYAMCALFILAIVLYFFIKPAKSVIYNSFAQILSPAYKFLYAFLVAPLDSLFTDVFNYYPESIVGLAFFIYCLLGLVVIIPILQVLKAYKKLCLYAIPFLLFATFVMFVYVSCHHIGLLSIFYVFVAWCVIDTRKDVINNIWTKVVKFILVVTLIVQLSWSYSATMNEIKLPYCFSKNVANFIKQYGLDKYKISMVWYAKEYYISKSTSERIYVKSALNEAQQKILDEKFDKVTEINFNLQDMPVIINPYFGRNIFYTYNVLNPEKEYQIREKMSDSDIERTKSIIKEQGLPDIITKNVQLNSVFTDEEIANANYVPFKEFYGYRIWKNYYTTYSFTFHIRKALSDELQLNNSN
ncbi:MAG: hypothetical protein IJY61_05745 [Candidatus Gastranaerophilales bacterium]|nr:hypothetical protein [Candidatus Gastranaerophilales bacterium]